MNKSVCERERDKGPEVSLEMSLLHKPNQAIFLSLPERLNERYTIEDY